jgi:hypothetical protein
MATWHIPHPVPARQSRDTTATLRAPASMAALTWASLTALHTQMYMEMS